MSLFRGNGERVNPIYATCTPLSEKNKDDDEDKQGDGGRDWCCDTTNTERGRRPSLPNLVEVECTDMHDQ